MPDDTPTRPSRLLILGLAAGFALAHTQAPLFYSNQNQYLLHGFALAGYGRLADDWLANTHDPTPAFSGLVAALYTIGGGFAIEAAFFLLLGAYFLGFWRLVEAKIGPRIVPFAAIFTAAHAAIFRVASVRLTGADYPWFLQCGLANQYLLGPGLQPSAFGVLLVFSAAAFARGRALWAALWAALAADIHATYLLPAALLTVGYAAALLREKRIRAAVSVSAVSLIAVMPMLLYLLLAFPPTDSETFAAAQHVLATVRIPHHAQVSRWFDWVAVLQLAWIALAWRAGRRCKNQGPYAPRSPSLTFALSIAAILAVILSAIQIISGNDTLALLFPWRISALLVPLATAIVAAKCAASQRYAGAANLLAIVVLAVEIGGGVFVMARGLGYQQNPDELPMMQYVREHSASGDLYLIPTRIPPSKGKRGVPSTSFTPPPRPQPGSQFIPVDLQRFRLETGDPIYVDFKSVPYAASEVLEWLRRVEQVQTWYKDRDWNRPELREQLRKEGITHVVAARQQPLKADFLIPEYQDKWYVVYRVKQ